MIKLFKNNLVMISVLAILVSFIGGSVLAVNNYGADKAQQEKEYTLKDMLTYAIQDEYLARAEYETIMNEFGKQRPFSNIINSEEYHIELLKLLFEEQGFEIPEDMAKDYLVIPENIEVALQTGVQAEEKNIAMYERFLEKNLPEEVKEVFMVLKNASQNHLNAFERGLDRNQGITQRRQGKEKGQARGVYGRGRNSQRNRGQGKNQSLGRRRGTEK